MKKIKESELLKCPFCNGTAKDSYYGEWRYITCIDCYAKGQGFDVSIFKDAVFLAREAWNKRK